MARSRAIRGEDRAAVRERRGEEGPSRSEGGGHFCSSLYPIQPAGDFVASMNRRRAIALLN